MEQQQQRLASETDKMVAALYQSRLKGLSKACYSKVSNCFDDRNSMQQANACQEKALLPMQAIQQIIEREMTQMDNRLQRCILDCQDSTHDKFPNNRANGPDAEKHFYQCASSCIDKHVSLLKSIQNRVEKDIDEVVKKTT